LSESAASAEKVLAICARQRIVGGPLVLTARHCRALYSLSQRNLAQAEKDWLEVLRLQRAEKQSILLPRTLNYLGMTAEFRGDIKAADDYYEEAVRLQSNNPRAFPVTSFNSHWLLATLLHKRGETRKAVELLEKAATVVEAARLNTWGDSQQRAGYFAQFAPGFEALVKWYVELGDKENAVVSAIRGRSRTLLDQLQLSGVDPRAALKGNPEGEKLLAREGLLRQKLNSLRARGQAASSGSLDASKGTELVRDFDAAQKEYAALWREILRENPLYQNLSEENPKKILEGLRQKVISPSGVMLLYYVGRDHSWLFTVGDTARGIGIWPLSIPEDIQNNATLLQDRTLGQSLAGSRGMTLVRRDPQPEAPTQEPPASKRIPLTARGARILVDVWSTAISQPDFLPTRGMRLESRATTKPVPTQRSDLPGEIFLPSEVRQRLTASAGVDHLLVIPDGPLHRIPLEALIVSRGGRPRYLLDELPPVIYSPSATILNLVTTRPAPDVKRTRTLLTVADPAYPVDTIGAMTGVGNYARSTESTDSALLSSRMPRLPFTATESQAVRRFFASKDVEVLENKGATEKRVTTAISGKTIVHIAAHGFADERFGNLFGALALTPPARVVSADDDGFLSLNEINDLPLKDCELAVLSACVTNVGPQRPLEAGVTLANGFLAAGARRVIASHWSVDDRSTSLLFEDFFARLSTTRGTPREYAKALHEARLKLRNDPMYAAPFYWAPFVLTGSAD